MSNFMHVTTQVHTRSIRVRVQAWLITQLRGILVSVCPRDDVLLCANLLRSLCLGAFGWLLAELCPEIRVPSLRYMGQWTYRQCL
jgi:hypothetical protein